MTDWPLVPPCAALLPLSNSKVRRAWWWPFRWRHAPPAKNSRRLWTRWSVRSRHFRSLLSDNGIGISARHPTTRCGSCWSGPRASTCKRRPRRFRMNRAEAIEIIRGYAAAGGKQLDYTPVLELAKRARFVLIGEASHGTHDFYWHRSEITKSLIRDHGFQAVAAEADWPDAYRVNRFVKGRGEDRDADTALSGFRRFPAWMWRNVDVLNFVEWLCQHNRDRRSDE